MNRLFKQTHALKIMAKTALTMLALGLGLNAFAVGSEDFEFHGYMRAGIGSNDKGGDQTCFGSPAPVPNFLRLANECGNYGELIFKANHLKPKDGNEGFFYTQFRFAYSQAGNSVWNDNNQDNQFVEAYAEGGKFDGLPFTYWIGKRFYRDLDIYMTDHFYHAQMNSNGAGIGNIPLLGGTLKLAYLKDRNSSDKGLDDKGKDTTYPTEIGTRQTSYLDAQLEGVKLTDSNSLKVWMSYGYAQEADTSPKATNKGTYPKLQGYAAGVNLQTSISDKTFNQVGLYYGAELLSSLTLANNIDYDEKTGFKNTYKDQNNLMFVEHFVSDVTDKFGIMASAYFGMIKKDKGTTDYNWSAVGFTPSYTLTEHFRLVWQIGGVMKKVKGQDAQYFGRVSFAPELTISKSLWGRPVLRTFATYSTWSDKGMQGAPYNNETSGANFGFQVESIF